VHGLEAPEERERLGKERCGRILVRLDGEKAAGAVVVTCLDDGAGVETAHLRKAAVTAGVITEAAAECLRDEEALKLMFLPGVSTAARLTESAGRGLGMSVVRHSVEALGGETQVRSVQGRYTEVELRLPLQAGKAPGASTATPPVEAA
jgi:two-component system chemotaxis sensor kinase CheA